MLSVVIPVINHRQWTDDCLFSLTNGTINPDEVILIDNGSLYSEYNNIIEKHRKLNLLYIRNEENIGVNASWNLALKITNRKYVLFLNNDTVVNKYFIEKVLKVITNEGIGICVPVRETTVDRLSLNNFPEENPEIEDCIYIEGWAFTMKKSIYDIVGEIPSSLKTYMGDTYFFSCSSWLGNRNVRMTKNTVYHFGNGTLNDIYDSTSIREYHLKENLHWKKMIDSTKKRVDEILKNDL